MEENKFGTQFINKNFEELPDNLVVEEVAGYLRIGRNRAYDLIRGGKINSFKIGREFRVRKTDLAEFINSCAA